MKRNLSFPKKIVWAVDPFEEGESRRSRMLETLREFSRRGAAIEPVYVLGPEEYGLTHETDPSWPAEVGSTIEKMIRIGLEGADFQMQPPRVLLEKRASLTYATQTLATYARRSGAEAIVVGTHGRRGLRRWFIGSFAETLLIRSTVPVLVVNPSGRPTRPSAPRRIVFATDLGPTADTAFDQAVTLAQRFGARLTLLHRLPHPARPLIQAGMYLVSGAYAPFPEWLERDTAKKRRIAEGFAKTARQRGVRLDVRLVSETDSTAEAVIAEARSAHASLIVIAARSGTVGSAWVGSIARQVVRAAPCPVWVVHARKR